MNIWFFNFHAIHQAMRALPRGFDRFVGERRRADSAIFCIGCEQPCAHGNLRRKNCVTTIEVAVDPHRSSKFLLRDTHDHPVFSSRIPTLSTLESEPAPSYRAELERLCRL